MTVKADLHHLIDQLTEEEATEALEYVRVLLSERKRWAAGDAASMQQGKPPPGDEPRGRDPATRA